MSAKGDDQWAWTVHLSESWHASPGCSHFPAQTMRLATALHTAGNIGAKLLQAELRAAKDVAGGKQPASLGGTPVRLLELMSSQLKLPSADHEGGSDPAHRQAALKLRIYVSRDESCQRLFCGLGRRTCQRVGMHIKGAQIS